MFWLSVNWTFGPSKFPHSRDRDNNPTVNPSDLILGKFKGETIHGGFCIANPIRGSLGEWVQRNSKELNPVRLYPDHLSAR